LKFEIVTPSIFISLHIAKIFYLFHKVDFTSGLPVLNVNFASYYAQALRMHEFLSLSGRFWGYDPFQMAGYVSGIIEAAGIYFGGLFAHCLVPFFSIGTIFLYFELLCYLLSPFLIYFSARNFEWDKKAAWMAFGLTVIMTGVFEYFSSFHNFYSNAAFWFQTSAYLSLWQVSLCWRWFKDFNPITLFKLTIATVLALNFCLLAIAIFAIPDILLFFLFYRTLRMKNHILLGLAISIVLILNWYWQEPLLKFKHWAGVPSGNREANGLTSLLFYFGLNQFGWHVFLKILLHYWLIVYALWSLFDSLKRGDRKYFVFGVWIAFLGACGFFVSSIPVIKDVQPFQLSFPFWLLTIFICSEPIVSFFYGSRLTRGIVLTVFSIYLISGIVYVLNEPRFCLINKFPGEQVLLFNHLKNEKFGGGRILIEMVEPIDEVSNPNFFDLIPHFTGNALVGGPNPGVPLLSKFCNFNGYSTNQEPSLFGKELKEFNEEGLSRYLDLYNAKWIVAFTTNTAVLLDGFSNILEKVEEIGPWKIYKNLHGSSWFLAGGGHLKFGFDSIVIDRPSAGEIILKFHWFETLKTRPEVKTGPVFIPADPLPFISLKLKDIMDQVEIFNGGI